MANYFFLCHYFTNAVANAILFHNGKMLYNHWFFVQYFLCRSCDQKDQWKYQKAYPPKLCSFSKQNFSMRFKRKKFRNNSLIFLVFMSLFLSPKTWSNNNSILNKISLKSLDRRKKYYRILVRKQNGKWLGLKVKNQQLLFYQGAFTQNAAFFCEHNLCLDNRVGKNKTQEK